MAGKAQLRSEYWTQFRTAEEKRRDEAWDNHQAGACNWETCEFCIKETDAIGRFVDEELDDDEQRCRNCGSTEFVRDGDVERCAECGR